MGTMPIDPEAAQHVEAETGISDLGAAVPVAVVEPVRILEYPPRTVTTEQIPVGTSAGRVVGELRTRATVTLAARGGDCYLGGESVTTGSGFLLPEDTALTLEATCPLFAVAAATGTTLHVLAQHRDG